MLSGLPPSFTFTTLEITRPTTTTNKSTTPAAQRISHCSSLCLKLVHKRSRQACWECGFGFEEALLLWICSLASLPKTQTGPSVSHTSKYQTRSGSSFFFHAARAINNFKKKRPREKRKKETTRVWPSQPTCQSNASRRLEVAACQTLLINPYIFIPPFLLAGWQKARPREKKNMHWNREGACSLSMLKSH